MRTKALVAGLSLVAVLAWSIVPAAVAKEPSVYTGIVKGVAVGGYDPVAYFTEGKPVVGNPAITHEHAGAIWRFASEASRAAFKADPAKYAPQYGGYCAYGAARGYKAPIDPTAWRIVDGKLYLNYSHAVQRQWLADIPGYIRKADENWPTLRDK